MAPRSSLHTQSPSTSSIGLPLGHSRRTSQASQLSQGPLTHEARIQALDHIHTSASRTETLTTFEDFGAPPRPGSASGGKSLAGDNNQSGLSGLYSRFKASVGAAKEAVTGAPRVGSHGYGDIDSIRSLQSVQTINGFGGAEPSGAFPAQSSAASAASSRLQSPLSPTFAESRGRSEVSGLRNVASKLVDVKSSAQLRHGRKASISSIDDSLQRVTSHQSRIATSVSIPQERAEVEPQEPAQLTRISSKVGAVPASVQQKDDEHARMNPLTKVRSTTPFIPMPTRDAHESDLQVSDSDVTPMEVAAPATRPIAQQPPQLRIEGNQPRIPLISRPSIGAAPQRPPLIQVSQSHLPGFRASRTTSSDAGGELSTAMGALSRLKATTHNNGDARDDRHGASRMRSKILEKELWMRDENAKDCFYCGDPFSTFRRKHHCRTCGNIFDSKCTVLAPGSLFGQAGQVRVCKPCEAIIYGTDDDSSVFSEEQEHTSQRGNPRSPLTLNNLDIPLATALHLQDDHTDIGTPTMAVPMSRKLGSEAKRRSAVIELDGQQRQLARPSSSRSLKSLSGRPRSSSHKRHQSRHNHQHMKSIRAGEVLAPFQAADADSSGRTSNLPAFHHDNIIDPDLAAYLSDEGSSGDESTNIFAAFHQEGQSPGKAGNERQGFGGLLSSITRNKAWTNEKGASGASVASRDADNVSLHSRNPSRHTRKRTLSMSTLHQFGQSPRRTKSQSLLRGMSVGYNNTTNASPLQLRPPHSALQGPSKMIRSSAMRGPAAPAVELNHASMQHVRRLLRQMLQDSRISSSKRWERALLPILLRCTDDVNPDIHRNDDIDIRHYIKLKKIPGGKPGDTSYISGIVFTKNLALKSMPRSIVNPRILIITFAVEYARHQQHFMSLDPVIHQEREYLRNLVRRILALNPQVLLVEKNVAGLALDLLAEANVAVAYNVKASVLSAVSRCTQTRLVTSVDKLNLDHAHVGRCANFDVKTYVHGRSKKTYLYLTGCQKDLGCTVVLRGAEVEELRKLKRVTEFMSYVVYNLKLETCVMRDEYVHIPASTEENEISPSDKVKEVAAAEEQIESTAPDDKSSPAVQAEIGDSGCPTSGKTDSAASLDVKESSNSPAANKNTPTFAEDIVERHQTRILSSSPFVQFMQPYLLTKVREQEAKLANLKRLRDQYSPEANEDSQESLKPAFELVQPEMVHNLVRQPSRQVRDFLHAVHSAEYEKARLSYQTLKRHWEGSCGNTQLFDPYQHQKIAVLYSMVNTKTSNPCMGPDVIALSFYAEHDLDDEFLPDITLGQYVEDLCHGANTPCSALGCGEPMFHHHRQYVHGDAQMSVVLQKYPSRIRGMHSTILMWSVCRICNSETQVIPMSENTWKYSFGKYLELTFWSTGLHPRAHTCPHDIHRDHARYFGFNNVAIRIQYDPVMLHEIIVPKPTITWKVDSDLKLKNEQYCKLKSRLDKFMLSVKARIDSIHVDSVVPEKIEACKAEVERLTKKANEDHKALTRKLQEKYMTSRYYEIIPLNRAARAIHENSIIWDELFADFEQDFFPSERDIRRLAALQLKKIFIERDDSTTNVTTVDEEDEGASEKEKTERLENPTPELTRKLSIMSPEDTKQVLDSVVKEQTINETLSSDDLGAPIVSVDESLPTTAASQVAGCNPRSDVDREDVKHLDLALSASLCSPQQRNGADSPVRPAEPASPASPAPGTPRQQPADRLEISPQVSKTVERMRIAAESDGTDLEPTTIGSVPHESRIPRPVEHVRHDGPHASPPMIRTRSQPQHSVPTSKLSRSPQPESSVLATTSTLLMGKTEKLKQLITDPARALERRMADRLGAGTFRTGRVVSQSLIPRSVPGKSSRVNTLARHFEQISREFERQRLRERQLRAAKGRRAYPLASSKPVVEVYRNEHEAVVESEPVDDDQDPAEATSVAPGSNQDPLVKDSAQGLDEVAAEIEEASVTSAAETDPLEPETSDSKTTDPDAPADQHTDQDDEGEESMSDTDQTFVDTDVPGSGLTTQPMSPSDSQLDLSVDLPKHERTSIMKLLTSFWSERSASGWTPLEYPFAAHEHVWHDSDIIIREDEPASIIALTLASADYQAKQRAFRNISPDVEFPEDEQSSIERNLLHPKNTNIRYAFQNRGVRAQCKIFFAESFDALRRKTGVADRFVESLSRCLKWDSKGGKTKSLFLKTLDDRFVLKSLSPVEVTAFFKLAPDYFFFIHQNLFTQLPSVIAKMFGLFQVTIRNPVSGIEFNWFMIVMENLFYDRTTSRRFDLKGSMRNRRIQSTGEKDEVLLDENLVDLIFEKPIFVREHTLKTLKNSVYNDTLFLSKQNVMDYSLMAGFDDLNLEIVVGIIDCIRTYTWDKKLETWIKDRGKNKPTVTSPKDYRNRFRIAMGKYILQAPDCWYHFQQNVMQARQMRVLSGRELEDVGEDADRD